MTATGYNFSSIGDGWLLNTINSSDTTLDVVSGMGANFSTSNFVIYIQAECMIVGTRSGDSFSNITRGANGTVATDHNSGERVAERVSPLHFSMLAGNVVRLGTTTPVDISASGIAGTSTSAARSDHVHFGVTLGVGGLALDPTTPVNIGGSAQAGNSASAAPGNHIHRGVASISTSGNAPSYGGIMILPGTGVSVSQSSASITITNTGGCGTINFNNNPIISGQVTLVQGTGASISQSGASITIGATATGGPAVSSIMVSNASPLQGNVFLVSGTGASLSQSGASITVGGAASTARVMTFWRSDVVATGIANQGLNLAVALTELDGATQMGTRQLVESGDLGTQVQMHVNCCVVVAVAQNIGVSILDVSNTANSLCGLAFTASKTGPIITKSAYINTPAWLTGDKTLAVYTASGNATADFIFKDISLRYKA